MPDRGQLYVVATPIGNLADFSPRAVAVLKEVAMILAEDTRHSKKLLQHFGIHTPLLACHEHNERQKSEEVIAHLANGQSYALISDAGTPVFSDPGAKLVAAVLAEGFNVIPVPGPCAAIAALSVSGFAGLPLHFYGFLPASSSQKHKILLEIQKTISGTLGFYEAPHRLIETLHLIENLWGGSHPLVLAKELTKVYETVYKNSVTQVLLWLQEDSKRTQGEFVLLFENMPAKAEGAALSIPLDALLQSLLKHVKLKEAVAEAVALTQLPKNQVYERALALKNNAL